MGPKYTLSDVVAGMWSHCSIWSLQGVAGTRTSLVAQMVKNLLTVQEIWVWSLSWEDPLEKGMATHSSILAWRIPWQAMR